MLFRSYCIGLYLRFHQLPFRKPLQVIGGISFGYVFFPLLLLFWLTEYANIVKYILVFLTLFSGYHAALAIVLKWQNSKFLIAVLLFFVTSISIYFIKYNIKTKEKIIR